MIKNYYYYYYKNYFYESKPLEGYMETTEADFGQWCMEVPSLITKNALAGPKLKGSSSLRPVANSRRF